MRTASFAPNSEPARYWRLRKTRRKSELIRTKRSGALWKERHISPADASQEKQKAGGGMERKAETANTEERDTAAAETKLSPAFDLPRMNNQIPKAARKGSKIAPN
jgi:hypothetical protein